MSHLGIGIGYQLKNHSNPTMHLTVFWEKLGKKVLISHARDVLINLFQDKILLCRLCCNIHTLPYNKQ